MKKVFMFRLSLEVLSTQLNFVDNKYLLSDNSDLNRELIIENYFEYLKLNLNYFENGIWNIEQDSLINNIKFVSFKIGTNKLTTIPTKKDKKYEAIKINTQPYSSIYYIKKYQIIGITIEKSVSPSTNQIKNLLVDLFNDFLNKSNFSSVKVKILPMKNPKEIYNIIDNSYAITTLWTTITLRNLIDTDKLFIQPMSKLADRMDANSIQTVFQGNSMDKDNLKAIVNSQSAKGENSTLRYKDNITNKTNYVTTNDKDLFINIDSDTKVEDIIHTMLAIHIKNNELN